MPKNTPSKQEKLEMLSYGFRSCTSYKWVATFRMILKISTIHKALSTAYGDKKSLSTVLLDMLRLIWKHRAWIDAYNNPEFFIEDYFVERLYLKNRDVNDYPMLYEGIRAMAYASIIVFEFSMILRFFFGSRCRKKLVLVCTPETLHADFYPLCNILRKCYRLYMF